MITVLDGAQMWQLYAVVYQNDLCLILTELFVGESNRTLIHPHAAIQKILRESRPIEARDKSRMMAVRFSQPIAWQVVDESYTAWDDYEEHDDKGVLQSLSRSKYLDYVNGNHGWYQDIVGSAKHYRVWTADEVIDVVSCEKPVVEPWEQGNRAA